MSPTLAATSSGTTPSLPATTLDTLLHRTDSPIHRLPAQVKLVALVGFVVVVVMTPVAAWPAFVGYAVLVGALVALARLPLRLVARRMSVELPFVLFALLLPFVAHGEQVDVLGVSVSATGLVGAALMLTKATIGVVAAIVLAATTQTRELLVGLGRLRLPQVMIAILGFALRYISIAQDDLARAERARLARGGALGRGAHLRSVAGCAGATFVRTYERGERVHQAMLARGLTGPMPALAGTTATGADWLRALALPSAAALFLVVSWLLR